MKKQIKEINNYIINNPFIQKEPIKHKAIINMFKVYKNCRVAFSRWWSLNDSQKYNWYNDGFFDWPSNAASVCIYENGDSSNLFFNIEHLFVTELIPKEEMSNVIKGINRFHEKHSANSVFNTNGSNSEYFKDFFDGEAFSHLGSFGIKKDSKLKKYIKQIHFRAINLSDSFCCLDIVLFLDERLKNDLSAFITGNVKEQKRITGYENIKWYKYKTLSYGTFSGNIYKNEILEMVLTDIKWNVLRELNKYIVPMIFQSQSTDAPGVCSINTNVSGNFNEEFWRSIDIYPKLCDFNNDMSACIAWRDSTPFYIYTKKQGEKVEIKNSIHAYHIGDELCSYLIASCVVKSVRSKLVKYSSNISKLKNRNIKKWLKSKVLMDTEMFYEARFMNEYKKLNNKNDFKDFKSLLLNNKTMTLHLHENIENRIKKTNYFYNSIINLYQSNMDYRNAKSNHKIQRQALASSIISTFFAMIAIIISIMSNDSAKALISFYWNWITNIFK